MEPNTENEKYPWSVMKIMDVSMSGLVGDYDSVDDVMEWAWVKQHASFQFVNDESESAGYELIINVANYNPEISASPLPAPEKLRPVFEWALENDIGYILFHND